MAVASRSRSVKVHDDVPSLLSDLRTRSGILTRCMKEYGTYLDELENDKKRLKELQDSGKELKQQTQIIEETTNMIPLTKQNAMMTCDNFIEFWSMNKTIVDRKLKEAESKDEVEKWKKEFEACHSRVSKTLEDIEAKVNYCPLNDSKKQELKLALNEIETASKGQSVSAGLTATEVSA